MQGMLTIAQCTARTHTQHMLICAAVTSTHAWQHITIHAPPAAHLECCLWHPQRAQHVRPAALLRALHDGAAGHGAQRAGRRLTREAYAAGVAHPGTAKGRLGHAVAGLVHHGPAAAAGRQAGRVSGWSPSGVLVLLEGFN